VKGCKFGDERLDFRPLRSQVGSVALVVSGLWRSDLAEEAVRVRHIEPARPHVGGYTIAAVPNPLRSLSRDAAHVAAAGRPRPTRSR